MVVRDTGFDVGYIDHSRSVCLSYIAHHLCAGPHQFYLGVKGDEIRWVSQHNLPRVYVEDLIVICDGIETC